MLCEDKPCGHALIHEAAASIQSRSCSFPENAIPFLSRADVVMGPVRTSWKFTSGQYYTIRPGSLNLVTLEFTPSSMDHVRFVRNESVVYLADGVFNYNVGRGAYWLLQYWQAYRQSQGLVQLPDEVGNQ